MATSWAVVTGKVRSMTATAVPVSETAPTTSTSVGIDISGISGLSVTVVCPTGETVTSGNFRAYWYCPPAGVWSRLPTHDVGWAAFASMEVFTIQVAEIPVGVGRFMLAPDTIVLSGVGVTLTMHYVAANLLGGYK